MTGQEAEAKSRGVYEAHHKQVLAYCLRRSRSEGWDAAADTFAVAWRRIDIAPDGAEALPWLYTIARMVLANTHLKHKSAARLKARIGGVARLSLVGPELQVVQRWEEHRLVETVNRLRPDDREALRLVTWEELSHSQIAEVLGISVTAVGQRVHRATKRLHVSDQELLSALRDVNPIPDPDLLLIDEAETRAFLATVQAVRPSGPLRSPAELRQRRWRLVAMAAAAVVLLLVGSTPLLLRVIGSDTPVPATSPTDPPFWLTWSRVPHDDAVFGGEGRQEMVSVTAAGPGLVAVGSDWTGAGQDAAVWTSSDGITWSRIPHDEAVFGGEGRQEMVSVAAAGPGLVAVGSDWTGAGQDAAVWTSPDGITWSRIPHNVAVFGGTGSQSMSSVTAAGPGLVAVGSDRSDAAVWVKATED